MITVCDQLQPVSVLYNVADMKRSLIHRSRLLSSGRWAEPAHTGPEDVVLILH